MWSHLGSPMGTRASARVTSTPRSAKASMSTRVGAKEP